MRVPAQVLASLPTTYVALLEQCRSADGSVLKVADAINRTWR